MNKSDVCFVRAKQRGGDYCFEAFENSGYMIMVPYRGNNLVFRCIREIWFRANLPFKSIWFNKKISKVDKPYFIVKDPLILPDFLKWMRQNHPDSKLMLDYDNRVSRSINPELVRDMVSEAWSYDMDDCKKFDLKYKHSAYLDIYRVEREASVYDVIYLGRDKGRGEEILSLEKTLNSYGLRTNFVICPDRAFMRYKKKYYKPYMSYTEYLSLLRKSKAILNIVPNGQKSITLREMEAVFDNVKCITNNVGVRNFELYDSSRYFILGIDNMEDIVAFLNKPVNPVSEEILREYKLDAYVEQLCSD